jgi:hypothetical protein
MIYSVKRFRIGQIRTSNNKFVIIKMMRTSVHLHSVPCVVLVKIPGLIVRMSTSDEGFGQLCTPVNPGVVSVIDSSRHEEPSRHVRYTEIGLQWALL